MKYLIHRNGQNFGPYSIDELNTHLISKQLTTDDLVYDGSHWITINQLLRINHSVGSEEKKKFSPTNLYIPPIKGSANISNAIRPTTIHSLGYRKRASFLPVFWLTIGTVIFIFIGQSFGWIELITSGEERNWISQTYIMLLAGIVLFTLGCWYYWLKDLIFGIEVSNIRSGYIYDYSGGGGGGGGGSGCGGGGGCGGGCGGGG